MAIRISRRIQSVLVGLVALSASAILIPSLASATPSPTSPPSIADVQKQLGTLAMQNAQLVEKYDQAQVDLAAKRKAAATASKVAADSQAQYEQSRLQLSQTVAAKYEGGAFSATGALLSSSNGQSYLDQLTTLNVMSAHIAQVLQNLSVAKKAATTAQHRAATLLATAKTTSDALAKQKDSVQKQVDKFTTLLATLTSAQRAAFQRASTPAVNPAAAAAAAAGPAPKGVSKAAMIAVRYALAQVGKPYVFGAAGPDAFDCSGLTMAAWAQAGVSLPHSAADQFNYGHHVSMAQLLPGDLIFLYQPIGHVEIYIGSGMLVSAPQPGENVVVVPLAGYSSDFTGATRLP